jgi:hypothetical protein
MLGRRQTPYKLFRGAFPSWDNSARRQLEPTLFINSSPEKYAFWLSQLARQTLATFEGDERLLFINAWNEWGEGCHLEPDQKYGMHYLEATRNALQLAEDMHEVESRLRSASEVLPFDAERWGRLLSDCYVNRQRLSDDELRVAFTFAPFALYCMTSEEKGTTRKMYENLLLEKEQTIEAKDKFINDIFDSLSWRITAPLRKLHSMLRK